MTSVSLSTLSVVFVLGGGGDTGGSGTSNTTMGPDQARAVTGHQASIW
ncbi:MAG: hypothetical protein R3B69_02755 [Candidatus Paceibacterota bacterium]